MKGKTANTRLRAATHSKLSLIENSHNFLNQSLNHYRKASRNVNEWPFAIFHLTQSIELMLKEALRNIHPLLIFEDIDHPKLTVSLEKALSRLELVAHVSVGEKEKINIRRAADYRNKVVHYEFELNKFECKKTFAQLFEFVHFFHMKYLRQETHEKIAKELWGVEARLMTYFREEFVLYNGVEMHRENPQDIVAAQKIPFFEESGKKYARYKYGEESRWLALGSEYSETPCHDCGVVKGQFHAERCDVEQCPKCDRQLLGCGCF
jgi:HEPN domain-containing protein